jgi:hypothetical protein
MVKRTTETGSTGGTIALRFVGLVWLGTTLYAAIAGSVSGALGTAAAALPGVVATMLVAGASIGALAGRRGVGARLRAGLTVGALVGVALAAGVRLAYGDDASIMVVAIVAGMAGGALAVLPGAALKAGLWATTWVFLAGVALGTAQPQLVKLVGGGEAGNTRILVGQSLVTGLVAALSALRLAGRRVVWCLVAGALPGVLLLGGEWLTRAGGAAVVELDRGFRTSSVLVELSDPERLRHGLIVLAVGGLIASLVCALRSLSTWSRGRRRRISVGDLHQSLARIGLGAGERYGFALAGGHAVRAAGFLVRPTEDIDLFTVWERRDDFDTAVRAIVDAYVSAGWTVETERRHDTFTRLTVSDGWQTANVDLGLDFRVNDPVRSPVGPVLHPDDVVANKMRALYERGHASDFIDIDAALRSGRYDAATLLRLAERSDITFDGRVLADALAKAQSLAAEEFAQYGLSRDELDGLRERLALWRAELVDAAGPAR